MKYAMPTIVVVDAPDAETAYEIVAKDASDATQYVGEACPISDEQASNPDWHALIFYGASESDAYEGRALPLAGGDA